MTSIINAPTQTTSPPERAGRRARATAAVVLGIGSMAVVAATFDSFPWSDSGSRETSTLASPAAATPRGDTKDHPNYGPAATRND